MKNKKPIIIISSIVLFFLIIIIHSVLNSSLNPFDPIANDRSAPPFTFNEEDIVLRNEDFVYINKNENYSILLGMSRNRVRSIVPEPYEVYRDEGRRHYIYNDVTITFDRNKFTLLDVSRHDTHFDMWETYRGINSNTTKSEVIEIFGRPTNYEAPSSSNRISYIFYKKDDDNYQKLRNREEVEWFAARRKHASRMRAFVFYFQDEFNPESMTYFKMQYVSPFAFIDPRYTTEGWKNLMGVI